MIISTVSYFLICFIVMMYVILDGFDLGIGILFPFVRKESSRDTMLNSIAPVWDGNETWLVLGGALLYSLFPRAYGELLPLLYMPVMLMLFALILRGVAFEFRFKAENKFIWNASFFCGSFLASFMQGIMLGTLVKGIDPSWLLQKPMPQLIWFTPFSVVIGFAVCLGYALLGATWVIMKSEEKLKDRMRGHAKVLLMAVSFMLLVVSLWTPWQDQVIFKRWFTYPNFIFLAPLPIFTMIAIGITWHGIQRSYCRLPFFMTIVIFLCGFAGIGISLFPYVIPRTLTLWEAASPYDSQVFLLAAVTIMLPVLLAYTAYAYYVFGGKVDESY